MIKRGWRWFSGTDAADRSDAGRDALDRGLARLRDGDADAAERAARTELARDPESAGAVFLLGMVAQTRDQPELALEQFVLALRRAPGHYDAALKAGLVLRGLGRHIEALRYFEAAVSIRPDSPTLNERAIAYMATGRLALAEADLRRAIAATPDLVAAHCNLGIVLRRAGAVPEAIEALARAVALGPDSIIAHCNLAASLRERDRHAEALEQIDMGLAIDPAHRDALVLKGLLLRELGRPQEALAVLSPLGPLPEALCNLGLVLQDLGRFDEANAAFERARKRSTHAHQAIFNRGMLRLLRGEYREGWRDYAHRFFTEESPRRAFGCADWWGEPLVGKSLLVYPEQGLGDEIMFSTCIPQLLRDAEPA
ncbi:MAG: tetratricopeptide repeat protein, partial [Proteobacteria bacterium]|nr:tetratricopeptide repeat protein [Pseudomonadota bacterium]